MALTFWDTVRGTRLADTITSELPKLTKQRKQKLYTFDTTQEASEFLSEELETGSRLIQWFNGDGKHYVIIEK